MVVPHNVTYPVKEANTTVSEMSLNTVVPKKKNF
jgi:hypothetical protein